MLELDRLIRVILLFCRARKAPGTQASQLGRPVGRWPSYRLTVGPIVAPVRFPRHQRFEALR
jgi:hypothetical protein